MRLAHDYAGETYRLAFTISHPRLIHVLHVFQKKSHCGRATPLRERVVIETRWQAARVDAAEGPGDAW